MPWWDVGWQLLDPLGTNFLLDNHAPGMFIKSFAALGCCHSFLADC